MEIRMARAPDGYQLNDKLVYDGTSDPYTHVINFVDEMEAYQVCPLARCRYFPITLSGVAKRWSQDLAPGSIYCWDQLKDLFIRQFQSCVSHLPVSSALSSIRQREGESMSDYLQRFDDAIPKVQKTTDDVIRNFLIAGMDVNAEIYEKVIRKNLTLPQIRKLISDKKAIAASRSRMMKKKHKEVWTIEKIRQKAEGPQKGQEEAPLGGPPQEDILREEDHLQGPRFAIMISPS